MPDPALSISCAKCGKRFRLKAATPGRKLRCPTPGCENVLVVPDPQQEVLELDDAEPEPPRTVRRPADEDDTEEPESGSGKSRLVWFGAAGVAALLVAVGAGAWLFRTKPSEQAAASSTGTPGAPSGGGPTVPVIGRTFSANGPRVTLFDKLPDSIVVKQYYITGEFRNDPGFGAPPADWPQTLPTGTESINIGIAFAFEPPNGTLIEVDVESETGPIQLVGGAMVTIRGPDGVVVELHRGSSGGAFPDGRYQTTIRLAGKKAAVLNWAVGERGVGAPASGLKGTKWRLRGGDGSRFEFGADGTLTVEFSWEMGAKRTGKWVAAGETFTGHAEALPGKNDRMEFRAQCLKDELRVRAKQPDGGWYPLGIFVKDDGKPVPKVPAGKDGEFPVPSKKDFDPPPK